MLNNRLNGTTEGSVSDRDGQRHSAPASRTSQRPNASHYLRFVPANPEGFWAAEQVNLLVGADGLEPPTCSL